MLSTRPTSNLVLVICSTLLVATDAYRILAICPTPASSHQIVFHSLVKTLAERGHELVAMTTNSIKTVNPNITEIVLSNNYQSRFATENYIRLRGAKLLLMGLEEVPWIIEKTLSHPSVQQLIYDRNQTFDAVIVEHLGFTPLYALAEYFNATFIGYTSIQPDANQHAALGHPTHPVLHNPNLLGYLSGSTLYRRVWNSLVYVGGKVLCYIFFKQFDWIITKHFGYSVAKSDHQVMNVDLLLLQGNPFLSVARPFAPNVKPISFLHVNPPKALPSYLEQFLDDSVHGAIYFSFGTMVRSKHMELRMMRSFKRVFDQLKYNVLWKREIDDMENSTSKMLVSSWFPQQDILGKLSLLFSLFNRI